MRETLRIAASTIALCLLSAPLAWGQQTERERRPPDTNETVAVTKGARLTINNQAGEVIVRTWDRDSLRVQARHSVRTKVIIRNTPSGVAISSSSSGLGSVDYDITAPAWMPVVVDGQFNFVNIEGAQSEVTATTVRGDIVVKGGTGSVRVKSIEGEINVDGAKGRIVAESVNEGIIIANSTGDIVAETTNGDISLTNVDAKTVEVGTVNGDVRFSGPMSGGRYRFSTHNGDIILSVPETGSATFSVRTYNGDFSTNLPLKGAAPADARRGRRVMFTLGSGNADVELESFGGTIRIVRPGTGRTREQKDKAP